MDRCYECNKEITDDEWMCNWGSCADCFLAQLEKYHKQREARREQGQTEFNLDDLIL
jgi:hypothetical protein